MGHVLLPAHPNIKITWLPGWLPRFLQRLDGALSGLEGICALGRGGHSWDLLMQICYVKEALSMHSSFSTVTTHQCTVGMIVKIDSARLK